MIIINNNYHYQIIIIIMSCFQLSARMDGWWMLGAVKQLIQSSWLCGALGDLMLSEPSQLSNHQAQMSNETDWQGLGLEYTGVQADTWSEMFVEPVLVCLLSLVTSLQPRSYTSWPWPQWLLSAGSLLDTQSAEKDPVRAETCVKCWQLLTTSTC